EDVLSTSAIEGEALPPASVRSSIARRLGLPDGGLAPTDRKVEGVVDMVLDATKNFAAPLTAERIFGWHAALFPTGHAGKERIDVGRWRTDRLGAMRVVSDIYAPKPRVHFEAPPAARLDAEMERFLGWFNGEVEGLDPLLRAGLAHLWFVTIHPMDDGNGRIARAIADLAVAQMERTGQRFYSMSAQIERDKKRYYAVLEETQKGDLDITGWLGWFMECHAAAVTAAEAAAGRVMDRSRFWQTHADRPMTDRQRKVLGKLLDGFQGVLTARKWASLAGCSPDTAQRDINDLLAMGVLERNPGGGRSTSYRLPWLSREEGSS
ncbi:MAG: Fic family protein, partial [Alphaproteobacteria bacterium]|nr:Fic family protein [Alphaproteobacteria bacterium]